ncbi:phage portal protein [Anaerovorax odorimutans]|uniref:phage portal protein n=1 Tax=Anaerovorax odorimutans TaxID=109327 RepID=UPI000412491D|nr:phage portal protein [Anaerovorax odorimutans]
MQAITQYLKNQGYIAIDDTYYSHITLWQKWYKGKVNTFHNYRQYNGRKKVNRTRKTLGMGKTVSEDWANLLLNEKVIITAGEDTINKAIWGVLDENDFRVRGNQLIELAFAMGTGALVEYKDGDKVIIDYIRAGMIYPLSWDNGIIKECAFASEKIEGKNKKVYLNIHHLNEQGNYVIENKMFIRNGNNLTPTDLPDGVAEQVLTGSSVPLFQIIKPNIVNNVDLDCSMGISIYANAIDQLEGCDLVYDSYCNEFRLGKKRIMVPITMSQMLMEDDGTMTPIFDDNDTEFYSMQASKDAEQKLQEINMQIRADDHDKGMDKALALLSKKCGMGNDRYKFENGQVKTATEVISEKSDLYQNLKKHEIILESALFDMVTAIASLLGLTTKLDITINFDDSIIEDSNAEKMRFLQEIRDGVRQKWEYRVKFLGETEEQAQKMVTQDVSNDGLMNF